MLAIAKQVKVSNLGWDEVPIFLLVHFMIFIVSHCHSMMIIVTNVSSLSSFRMCLFQQNCFFSSHTHIHRIGMESYSSSLQPYQVSSVCVCLPLSYFFISLSISGLCPPHQIWEIMVYEHKSPIPISLTGHFATEYNEWRRRQRQRQRLRRRSTIIYVASNGTLIYIWLQQQQKKGYMAPAEWWMMFNFPAIPFSSPTPFSGN